METRKEELQKQLRAIAKQEEKELIAKHYPEFKKLVGKFFKIRNTYGSNCKGWWLYRQVTEIKPPHVYDTRVNGVACLYNGWSFETCTYKHTRIEKIKQGYVHSLGKEITKQEFLTAYNKMLKSIPKP